MSLGKNIMQREKLLYVITGFSDSSFKVLLCLQTLEECTDPMKWELDVVVSCTMCKMGTELRSSGRAASVQQLSSLQLQRSRSTASPLQHPSRAAAPAILRACLTEGRFDQSFRWFWYTLRCHSYFSKVAFLILVLALLIFWTQQWFVIKWLSWSLLTRFPENNSSPSSHGHGDNQKIC